MLKKNSWFKPYILNPYNIQKVVLPAIPGVYVLGNLGPDKKVKVQQIGSSSNARSKLMENLGKYQVFMYKPFKNLLSSEGQGQQPLHLNFS